MEILAEVCSPVLALAPFGRLDSNSSPELERRALAEIAAGAPRLVIDLERVDYISSAGLRALLVIAKKLKQPGSRLALCGMTPAVRQIFELAGFLSIFTVEASRADAFRRAAE
jgi:stage II sporulation protein AA (anti-sigma F factor antagonist)